MMGGTTDLIYFHGMPGGPGEWAFFAPQRLISRAIAPDRNAGTAWDLAETGPGTVTLIGFSLGAARALEAAARWGDRVAALHLIAPAAPLQLGNFLPHMAGGALFGLAARQPTLFRLIARAEGLAARHAPHWLCDRLFTNAQGADAELARDEAFRRTMAGILRSGLGRNPSAFAREVMAYVSDWRDLLGQVTRPVTIWQGTADNWVPPAMAQALACALPGPVETRLLPGLSHYSALREALQHIA
jgi:pimeloyl-ACP methyl ester carboxylesterase